MAGLIDTVAWVHVAGGRVLGTRSRGQRQFWVPGGKRHDGESDLDTLLREIGEELSVALLPESVEHFGTYEAPAEDRPVAVRVACYTARYAGTLSPAAEIEELAWLAYADRHRTPPVDRLVFDALKDRGLLR